MTEHEESADKIAAVLRARIPAKTFLEAPDTLIDDVIRALLSPGGRTLLREFVDDLSRPPLMRLDRWWSDGLGRHSTSVDAGFRDLVLASMQPMLDRLSSSGRPEAAKAEGTRTLAALGLAAEVLKNLAPEYNVPIQVIEALDDIKGLPLAHLEEKFGGAPTDGIVAALLAAAFSAALQTNRISSVAPALPKRRRADQRG